MMTYKEFFKRVKMICENTELDAEETTYFISELIQKFEAEREEAEAA
jgi:hypothetical protein